jgi:zinc/manganese transport system substrate-binding protein
MRSRTAQATLSVLLVAVLAGCADADGSATKADGDLEVVASTNVWGDIAAQIGGQHVHVTSFISSPSQDPHSYEASGRNLLVVSKADLVIENGGGYDDFIDDLLDSAGGDSAVLNAVELSGLDSTGGDGEFNEHVWYDLPTAVRVADAVAAALADADPANRADYRANAAAFETQAQHLIQREEQAHSAVAGRSVAITEPVPGYLLDALGLVNATPPEFSEAVEEGEDVPVAVLLETLDLFSHHAVDALVYNEQSTGAVTEQVLDAAADAAIPAVPVTETLPDGEDFLAWMAANLRNIIDAVS